VLADTALRARDIDEAAAARRQAARRGSAQDKAGHITQAEALAELARARGAAETSRACANCGAERWTRHRIIRSLHRQRPPQRARLLAGLPDATCAAVVALLALRRCWPPRFVVNFDHWSRC